MWICVQLVRIPLNTKYWHTYVISFWCGVCVFLRMKHVTAEVKTIVNLIWSKSYVQRSVRLYEIYSQIKDFGWDIEPNIKLHAYQPTTPNQKFIYSLYCTVTKVLIPWYAILDLFFYLSVIRFRSNVTAHGCMVARFSILL